MADPNIEDLYRQFFPLIRDKCQRMLKDGAEAQDIAQETFMRLWSHRDKIDDPRAAIAWLYRTSTRLAIDRYRRTQKLAREPAEPVDGSVAELMAAKLGPSSPDERAHSRRILRTLADRAPRHELEAAILSRLDGLTHQEIGLVVGASSRTVRRWLTRFDGRLARLTAADR